MFNKHDIGRDAFMLTGAFAHQGYDWWWHSFTGRNRQTGEERPFFIEFFLCNPALGGEEPVLGQLPQHRARGVKPSYLMVKAGAWGAGAVQLHRFFGWKQVRVREGAPYEVEAADCLASETILRGHVRVTEEEALAHPEYMCGAGEMRWDLALEKQIAFNVGYGASKPMRDIEAFQMYWHAEGMKTAYRGTVEFGGELYDIAPETCCGYADKNWGSDFTSPWVWLASSSLVSRLSGKALADSAFDIGGGRPKIGPVALDRRLLAAFWHEGKGYEFNFSKFWDHVKTEFHCEETDELVIWHVQQESDSAVMITDVTCKKRDMLLINYEAPDGKKHYDRLWNGGNGVGRVQLYEKKDGERVLVDDMDADHIGCEYGEFTR